MDLSLLTLIIGLIVALLGLVGNALYLVYLYILLRQLRRPAPVADDRFIEPLAHLNNSPDEESTTTPMLEMTHSHTTDNRTAKTETRGDEF